MAKVQIIEILAIIGTFIVFYLQRRKKSITYSTLTSSEVITISDKVKDNNKIQISYLGRPISNLQLLEIRIKNTGNLPIKPDDYIDPLAIRYPKTTNLISVDVIDQQSLDVNILSEESDTTKTILSKTLLNPNDFFDIRIIFGEGSRDFSITGRIVGVSKIQSSAYSRPFKKLKLSRVVYLLLFSIFLIFIQIDKVGIVEAVSTVGIAYLILGILFVLNYFLEELDKRNDK